MIAKITGTAVDATARVGGTANSDSQNSNQSVQEVLLGESNIGRTRT